MRNLCSIDSEVDMFYIEKENETKIINLPKGISFEEALKRLTKKMNIHNEVVDINGHSWMRVMPVRSNGFQTFILNNNNSVKSDYIANINSRVSQ